MPERNPLTSLNLHAVIRNSLVISSLLGELLGCLWEQHADIELGDSYVDFEVVRPGFPDLEHGGGEVAEGEMALGADAVDGDALGFELTDEGGTGLGFGGVALEVVLGIELVLRCVRVIGVGFARLRGLRR